jgi:MoaA/NifB/PqqE/SkfB family radical SAM enzyme
MSTDVLRIIQVEITTFCNARCVYCPVAVYSNTWRARHMDFGLFTKIVEEAAELGVEYIHLQGWGEPLLHPRFFEMLSLTKRRFKAGFTTNGELLTPHMISKIVDVGVDVVAVTFAGASSERHNKYRLGTDFETVLKNVGELARRIDARVVAVYMMLKDSVDDLPRFVEKAAEAGVREINLSNVVYIPHPSVWGVKVFSNLFSPPPRRVVEAVRAAIEVGKRVGVVVHSRLFSPWEQVECPEAPTSSIYIGVDGDVSPCVYLNIPAEGAVRCFENKCESAPRVVFGNIKESRLAEVVTSKKRRDFVDSFERRKRGEAVNPPEPCRRCYLLYGV